MSEVRTYKYLSLIFLVICLSMILTSCGSLGLTSTPTPIPPTSTPTPIPPTSTPTPIPPTETPAPPTLTPMPEAILVTPVGYGIGMYLKSIGDQAFTITLSDEQGNQATIELVGELRWGGDGAIEEPASFVVQRIQTPAQPDTWYLVDDMQIVDGLLIITTENGVFPLFTEGYTTTPIESKIMYSEIVSGGFPHWIGPARFIITGLYYDFSGLIYMDTRSFSISR